jgi:hypothetical protein
MRFPERGAVPSVGTSLASAQGASTELQQQSDHRRRVERAKKAAADTEVENRQIAAIGVPEAASRDFDYLVFIVLAASVVVLAFIARRKRRAGLRL